MGRPEGGYLFINQKGKRFMAESTYLVHRKAPLEILSFDHDNAEYPNLPAYMICDQSYFGCGSLATTRQQFEAIMGGPVGYAMTRQIYEWSTDNSAEITKGWIKQSDTLADLAKEIGIDAIAFDQTAETFNSSSAKKQDPQFNRTENTLAPLISPPFYAIELALTLINTQGGPKHDIDCRVLDYNDQPIPGLYAAGELGSFFGFLYQGGSNYPEAWAFGRIAGERVAAETDRA